MAIPHRSGFLKFSKDTNFGDLSRDKIYLGNTCYSYEVWRKNSLLANQQQLEEVS